MRLLVFSDMDGTFVTADKTIPQENLRALDALAASGGAFVPCTGRPAAAVPQELVDHPACRWVVAANGAQIYEVKHPTGAASACGHATAGRLGALVHERMLGRERAHQLVEALEGVDVTIDIFSPQGAFDRQSDYDRMDQFVQPARTLEFVKSLRTPLGNDIHAIIEQVEPVRITLFYNSEATRKGIVRAVDTVGGLSMVSSMPQEFEISDAEATKGNALRFVHQLAGADNFLTAAFGDSSNDISMLRVADKGFAMANATDEAKAAAAYTTRYDNDAAGVGYEIEALIGSL